MNDEKVIEKQKQCNTFYRRLFCKKCDIEMTTGNLMIFSNPPGYEYTCSSCGCVVINNDKYPLLVIQEIDE